jgi:hypothetical protein
MLKESFVLFFVLSCTHFGVIWIMDDIVIINVLAPTHSFESAWFSNQSHLVTKQENHGWKTGDGKFGRKSISLILCRLLLRRTALLPLQRKCALIVYIAHENPTSSAGPEPAAASPRGPVALTARLPRRHKNTLKYLKRISACKQKWETSSGFTAWLRDVACFFLCPRVRSFLKFLDEQFHFRKASQAGSMPVITNFLWAEFHNANFRKARTEFIDEWPRKRHWKRYCTTTDFPRRSGGKEPGTSRLPSTSRM